MVLQSPVHTTLQPQALQPLALLVPGPVPVATRAVGHIDPDQDVRQGRAKEGQLFTITSTVKLVSRMKKDTRMYVHIHMNTDNCKYKCKHIKQYSNERICQRTHVLYLFIRLLIFGLESQSETWLGFQAYGAQRVSGFVSK